MPKTVSLTTPLTDEMVSSLVIGDKVLLSGIIYSARDAAHKRLIDLLDTGKTLPFDIRGQIIYYVGPSPAKPGRVIGAAGPTTSYRMDPYAPRLMELGLKGMIGKGKRSSAVKEAIAKYKAVYLGATGGAGGLIFRAIKGSEGIAHEGMGAEAHPRPRRWLPDRRLYI